MRLGALIFGGISLIGQAPAFTPPKRLPWQPPLSLPWQALERQPAVDAYGAAPVPGRLRVSLSQEGLVRVWDGKGLERLAVGLPGRPRRIWRDGGLSLDPASAPWTFPEVTPLAEGAGGLAWGEKDLRPSLVGLLWIIEDGERILTVLHPALARAIHLALPPIEGAQLAFGPDRLVLRGLSEGRPAAWSLPWVALLPAFTQLGAKPPVAKLGTAINPFPN